MYIMKKTKFCLALHFNHPDEWILAPFGRPVNILPSWFVVDKKYQTYEKMLVGHQILRSLAVLLDKMFLFQFVNQCW